MKFKKITIFVLGLIILFIFFCFSYIVKKHFLTTFDFNTTVKLQGHDHVKFDKYFLFFSSLANVEIISIFLLIFLIWRRKILSGLAILFLFAFSHIVEIFGKVFINHPPPPFMFYRHPDVTAYTFQKYYVQEGNSYPSGHSFRSVFLAALLIYVIWRSQKLSPGFKFILICCIIGLASLIMLSKIIIGDHWASDVIGGIIFGLSMGMFGIILL